jgi:hypothetical protein
VKEAKEMKNKKKPKREQQPTGVFKDMEKKPEDQTGLKNKRNEEQEEAN